MKVRKTANIVQFIIALTFVIGGLVWFALRWATANHEFPELFLAVWPGAALFGVGSWLLTGLPSALLDWINSVARKATKAFGRTSN